MSEDPIGFTAGDTNLNRYVGNGPVNGTDPSGLDDNEIDSRPFPAPWKPNGHADADLVFKRAYYGIYDELLNAGAPPEEAHEIASQYATRMAIREVRRLTAAELREKRRMARLEQRRKIPDTTPNADVDADLDALFFDLTIVALDIGGIVDPTPACDGVSAILSLSQGDVTGAALSAVGFVPWVGDLAKLGKLGRVASIVRKAIAYAKKSERFAKRVMPGLRQIHRAVTAILESKTLSRAFPEAALDTLRQIRKQLDEFFEGVCDAPKNGSIDLSLSAGAAKARPDILPSNARSLTGKSGVEEVFRRLDKYHGIDRNLASKRLHEIKDALGYAPDDDLLFDLTGNIFDPKTREWIGSLTEGGAKGGF